MGWLWLAVLGCRQPAPVGETGGTVSTFVEDDDGTSALPPETTETTACAEGVVRPEGLELAVVGATVRALPGALPPETALWLCPVDASTWEVRFEGVLAPNLPLWVELQGKVGAATAMFVPGIDGLPQRALLAEPSDVGLAGPVYRAGPVFLEEDPRAVIPWAPRASTADVLLVVDDSCSMLDEQLKLSKTLPGSVLDALDAVSADYHLGVITTDNDDPARQGRLVDVDGVRWIETATEDRDGLLAQLVYVGNDGSGDEQGLATTVSAMSEPWNDGFLREGAGFAVVVVSDEDDGSELSGADVAGVLLPDEDNTYPYYGYGGPAGAAVAAFHSLVETDGPDRGSKYIDASEATGGLVGDLTDDWTVFFEDVVAPLAAAGGMLVPSPVEPELWRIPADGTEPTQLEPDAVGWDPVSGSVYPTRATEDVVWVVY